MVWIYSTDGTNVYGSKSWKYERVETYKIVFIGALPIQLFTVQSFLL